MNKEIFNNLSNMLNNSVDTTSFQNSSSTNNYDNFQNIFSNFSSNNNSNDTNNKTENFSNNFDFSNFDMATIMKIKNIMNKLNSKKDDPRSALLLSLKPYLKPSRKEKLDQYMKFINIASVMQNFTDLGDENIK